MPLPTRLFILLLSMLLPRLSCALPPTEIIRLPFDVVGGLVVVRDLALDERRGDFVLDTGNSFGLVVEATAFAGQLRPAPTRGLSATGLTDLSLLSVRRFRFGAATYTNLTASATSLATVQRLVGPRLLGIIGYELLRGYEVVLDYAHHRLTCYPLTASRQRPFTRRDSLAFEVVQGKPLATGYIGITRVRWLLDTGAGTNHLDQALSRTLPATDQPHVTGTDQAWGAAGPAQAVRQAILPRLQLGATEWKGLPVALTSLARPSSGRPLPYQGILGYPFLSQDGLVSFHYGRQQFYVLSPRP